MRGFDKETLRYDFKYDPKNGGLYWKRVPFGGCTRQVGGRFGTLEPEKGYRIGKYRGKSYREHVLIYCYHFGKYPEDRLISIMPGKTPDKIENIRCLDYSSLRQLYTERITRSTPYRGVYLDKYDNICVKITKDRKQHYLGTKFKTQEQAAKAYDKAALALFGPDARLNFPEEVL